MNHFLYYFLYDFLDFYNLFNDTGNGHNFLNDSFNLDKPRHFHYFLDDLLLDDGHLHNLLVDCLNWHYLLHCDLFGILLHGNVDLSFGDLHYFILE